VMRAGRYSALKATLRMAGSTLASSVLLAAPWRISHAATATWRKSNLGKRRASEYVNRCLR